MSMLHIESGLLYCTHCDFHFSRGWDTTVYHPRYEEIGKFASVFSAVITSRPSVLDKLKTCPHAGHTFRFPEAVQLAEKED